ncbi:MAG: folate family ECF transporter S component [Ruminococcus sp.]|nr:folate family ECF transporter S component [Ruminococcus sp.]
MTTSTAKNKLTGSIRIFGNLRVMILSGIFIALSIVFGKFLNIPIGDNIRISLENTPIIMSGVFFGPFIGGAVGVTADLVGCILKGYAINPVITLGALTIGFSAGLFAALLKKAPRLPAIAVSVFAAHIPGSMIIKSIGLRLYFGTPYSVLLWRIPTYIAIGIIEVIIIYMLTSNKAFSAQLDKLRSSGGRTQNG